uniref:NADH-ubiquinone oxidoreductase chain 4 n=1 Tax=Schmidtea mediterranea TaxID=79327 RepID=A0A0B4VJ62_SCHMD|nr:NADH dehydrogenase subunit 4 [Schmidtea mediterranea]
MENLVFLLVHNLLLLISFFNLNYLSVVSFYNFLFIYLLLLFNNSSFSSLVFNSLYFSLGSLNYLFVLLVVLVFFLLYVLEYLNLSYSLFYVISLLSFFVSLFYTCNSLLYVFICFEFSFFLLYLVVVVWGYNPERIEAVSYFLIYSFCGSLPIFFAVSFMIVMSDSSLFVGSLFGVLEYSLCYSSLGLEWLFVFYFLVIVLGFFFKFPIWGLHSWLPKAHVEAPVLGSVLLAALMVKLGVYGIIRYFSSLFGFSFVSFVFPFLFVYLSFSVFMSNFSTTRQFDNKSFIAYSSIVHMTMISLTFWSGSLLSLFSALILSFSHGLISLGLFVSSGYMYSLTHSRSFYLNRGYLYIYSLFIFLLSVLLVFNCSFPLSLGFFSEVIFIYLCSNVSFFSYTFMVLNVILCGFYCVLFYLFVSLGFGSYTVSFSLISDFSVYFSLFIVSLVCVLMMLALSFLIF